MALPLSHSKSNSRRLPSTLMVAAAFAGLLATPVSAQDAPKPRKDAALEDLLKEIKTKDSSPAPKAGEQAKTGTARKPDSNEKAPTEAKPPTKPGADAPAKPAADVAPRDKALDTLLEKLGESNDKPTPDDRSRGGPPMPDDKDKDKGNDKEPRPTDRNVKPGNDPLTGKAKDLDEHLEELTGKKRRKNGDKNGEDGGAMSEVVKQMREVEQRLGKEDTGEETRKKQQEIVKNLDTLIEQLRSSSSQSKGKQKSIAMKPGQKPGGKPGQTPGTTGGNAPFARPQKPTDRRALAGGKDEWGHLPPELRQEMDNVFKEDFLPSRQDLIERYYNALAKKSVKRGEGQP